MQGRYDSRISLSANTKIGSALLSRFDIVLVLRDMRIPTWDATIADHLLGLGSDSLPKPDCLVFLPPFYPSDIAVTVHSQSRLCVLNPWKTHPMHSMSIPCTQCTPQVSAITNPDSHMGLSQAVRSRGSLVGLDKTRHALGLC